MPNPVLRIDLRNCFGMMASVSTFSRSMGATRPLWMVNCCMVGTPVVARALAPCLLVLGGRALDLGADLLHVLAEALHGAAGRKRVPEGQEECNVLHGTFPYAN